MALKGIALLVLIFVTNTLAACPMYWTEFNGNCYLYVGTPASNWKRAEEYCVNGGSHLASVHSKEEDDYIRDLWRMSRNEQTFFLDALKEKVAPISVAPFVYIGLNDRAKEGTYEWTDGSPVDYVNWMRNNPSSDPALSGREDGVFIWDRKNEGKWNDVRTKSPILIGPFICKRPAI
ncbi:Brevican core protein [Holothuria leucospilota]|uniref:Brevican core protein n=1 Tax=Holothuria leucospilota TaxID=206669 RepID=A0A9Q1BMH9_HOLLE|nr:Brevican core protein [Holothuria leucospilota]